MLYVTTKDQRDAYTAHRALREYTAPDGGNFVPLRLQELNRREMMDLCSGNSCEIMAGILNLFFGCKLTQWDIQLCIGQRPETVHSMPHKMHVAQLWNNPKWSLDFAVQSLAERIGLPAGEKPGRWVSVAVQIGMLFCVFADLKNCGVPVFERETDVAVATEDFSAVMAVLYSRKMGLPVGRILCGSNENGCFWDLLNHGQMRTSAPVVHTETPLCDYTVAPHTADLILQVLGKDEVKRFDADIARRGVYTVTDEDSAKMSEIFFSAVIGRKRMNDIISSVYTTNQYLMGPYTALAYGAVQDYRASGGSVSDTIVLCRWSAYDHRNVVAKSIGVPEDQIRQQFAWN